MAELAERGQPTPASESDTVENDALLAGWEARELRGEELKAAYAGWLERRGIDPASIPHLTMGEREFDLFRNAPSGYLDYVKRRCEIPRDDQDDCKYALIDVVPDDANLPQRPALVEVTEADFGTVISPRIIAKDFQDADSDSDGPSTPESGPTSAYATVDIGEALASSYRDLRYLAATIMQGETANPFSRKYGDVAVRAGEPAPEQKDAYVWTTAPIAKSVELTLNNPYTYDSVCVVRGRMKEAGNGKPGMAQIDDPEVVLKIEGENLAHLQSTYRELYRAPDFALTAEQRAQRDELFNGQVASLIAEAAHRNRAHEEETNERHRKREVRYRERP